jgi:hypothetical protein
VPRIPSRDYMHGAAVLRLLPSSGRLTIEPLEGGYLVNDRMGVWVKTTSKALPAYFQFNPEEMRAILALRRQVDAFQFALVCPTEGICAVSWEQFEGLVAVGDPAGKTLRVSRSHDTSFRVKGTDKAKPIVVPVSRWGPRLLDL